MNSTSFFKQFPNAALALRWRLSLGLVLSGCKGKEQGEARRRRPR